MSVILWIKKGLWKIILSWKKNKLKNIPLCQMFIEKDTIGGPIPKEWWKEDAYRLSGDEQIMGIRCQGNTTWLLFCQLMN